ncbi:ABC-three component system protein [Pelagovum pacificum]|uniref:ABC-three component systems C-terminal domain-containing protein n=1 Tax=Pelagovum pacificum TaxID=2588711 RepID=A0A5C5GCG3_9RHOB|nr:ABC-three component system protein [Pelagovum pacificum]QQA42579.1 hypothetical protein I8N54_17605 [Pelagovum pacificum]TNY31664.1 hypothetical protein FHY64_16805 [Pelagovum pacificum]
MHKADFDEYFDRMFETCNQTRFEDWFAELAHCAWGTDFETIKAGGKHGDKKSDGRHRPTETIYQCYAPESASTFSKNSIGKVNDSFPEVINYWPKLKRWVLVHNNNAGIPTKLSDALEKLREEYPHIEIDTASRRFLKDELHDKLSMNQMLDVYPSARLNFRTVSMENVRPLLKRIIGEKSHTISLLSFGEIPNEKKLDHNELSPDAKFDLNRAAPNIGIVDRFLESMSNPGNASIIQSGIQSKYLELRDFGHSADEILGGLLAFVRGPLEDPAYTAAAYVIIYYYFDACDIFENPPEDALC